jgi:glyoxylase-like metal-dependent hydrolase (beta-lactamase superfamily II)
MTSTKTLAAVAALLTLAACSPKAEHVQAPAAAPVPSVQAEAVHRFKIGRLDAAALLDGTITTPNDGKTFGLGRPTSEVAAALKAAGLPQDRIELDLQPLLVRSSTRVMLFDTGAGKADFAQAGRLQDSLRTAGATPAEVTDIFISHAHPDHVGGLLTADGQLAFPEATIHISEPEWDALKADPGQRALVAAILPKVAPFRPGAVILPDLVTAVEVKGHTPGHSAYEIVSGADRLIYIGDTAHHSVISVQKPDWLIQFDHDGKTAAASRRAFLQRAADENLRLYAVHFPFPGLGRVKAAGDAFVWVPEQP